MMRRQKKLRLTDTLIGQGTTMDGHLTCQTNLRIEGHFQGEIEASGTVTIGEQGVATANIQARELMIAGKVYGDVTTKGKLIITSKGQFHGNYHGSSIIIHEGGIFSGESRMEKLEPRSIVQDSEIPVAKKNKKQAG
ncbi:polymer-forming cytoskeletal protein [Paenibacillus terrigena]|uniref:bactofilin family protein n=1 Tax=Paenibacillus terrigena TaxID=369333 RepID=UPI0028D7DF36|nr:polymer-forming cytoskeletal protein [Paenibacillus terrigena]